MILNPNDNVFKFLHPRNNGNHVKKRKNINPTVKMVQRVRK
jgi:hypothetical protein